MEEVKTTEQEVKPVEDAVVQEDKTEQQSQEAAEVVDAEKEELKQKVREFEINQIGLVEQIKELRTKNRDKETTPDPEDKTAQVVKSILVQNEKKKALETFVQSHKEFSPENDPNGVKMTLLNSALSRYNTSDATTAEEMRDYYEEALSYLNRKHGLKTETKPAENNSNASMPQTASSPKSTEAIKLTTEQEAIRKERGWTVEKYLEMRAKYPGVMLP